jgi:hypothetical protein
MEESDQLQIPNVLLSENIHFYQLNRRLSGLRHQSGYSDENFLTPGENETPGSPAPSPLLYLLRYPDFPQVLGLLKKVKAYMAVRC